MLTRRNFLWSTGVATAALAAWPAALLGQELPAVPMPAGDLYDRDQERFWAEVRKQFVIPPGEVYLNNGTVGSNPLPVLKAVFDGYMDAERLAQEDSEDYPIWGYGPFDEIRDPLAAFVGARRQEIALLRNATEGNNYMAGGLEMKQGDEVLMSDQEHPNGEAPWNLRAKRQGIVVKKFELPKPPASPAEILNRISDAITPRTRVLFVSHITTVTGLVLPVKEISALARSKGIVTAIDGAHVIGMMKLDLHDLGCDMYSSSPHKWLQAPKGTGFLYVREEVQDRVWNTVAGQGWNAEGAKAERFQMLGSSNLPALLGLRAALKFANDIGLERIERRHRQLGDFMLKEMLARGAESLTSPDAAMRCAIISVNVPPVKRMELQTWMWKQHRIRIRGGEPSRLRLSCAYYLLRSDLERFLEKYDEFRKTARG